MGFRCLRQQRAQRGTPAAPGGAMLDAMYLRCPGYGVTGFGAAGGARTRGLLFPKQVRFQLRYSDMERAEAVNFFRASAMAMADKRPFASGCPHEKGPRSVVGACPSAGPLPGDLPASGRGVLSGGPWQPKKKPPAGFFFPACGFHRYSIAQSFSGFLWPILPPQPDGSGKSSGDCGCGRRRSSPTAVLRCTAG